MNCMVLTKHPSPFGFLLQGRFWVLQQWGSSSLLQGREGRECPGGQCPCGKPHQQRAEGPHPPSHTTTASLQVTHSRGSKRSSGTGGRDMTCPPAEMNPHCPPQLLISSADTWWPGWGKKLPRLKSRQGGWGPSLEGAEKVPKQVIAECWQWGCVVFVLQVWAWLMRKLWREANSPSAWQFQPSLTRVGLGTDREEHRDCTARAAQVTDEYQGSKMLLLDLSAVFDALRYCWVAFDPRQE